MTPAGRTADTLARGVRLAAVLAALAGFLLGGGSVPHTHEGHEPGYYNHEHDLTLLAGLASDGPLPDIAPAAPVPAAAAPVVLPAPAPVATGLAVPGLSRAPPAA